MDNKVPDTTPPISDTPSWNMDVAPALAAVLGPERGQLRPYPGAQAADAQQVKPGISDELPLSLTKLVLLREIEANPGGTQTINLNLWGLHGRDLITFNDNRPVDDRVPCWITDKGRDALKKHTGATEAAQPAEPVTASPNLSQVEDESTAHSAPAVQAEPSDPPDAAQVAIVPAAPQDDSNHRCSIPGCDQEAFFWIGERHLCEKHFDEIALSLQKDAEHTSPHDTQEAPVLPPAPHEEEGVIYCDSVGCGAPATIIGTPDGDFCEKHWREFNAPAEEADEIVYPAPAANLDIVRLLSYESNDIQELARTQRELATLIAQGWQVQHMTGDLIVTILLLRDPAPRPTGNRAEARSRRPRLIRESRSVCRPIIETTRPVITLDPTGAIIDVGEPAIPATYAEALKMYTAGNITKAELERFGNQQIYDAARSGWESAANSPITAAIMRLSTRRFINVPTS